MWWGTRRAGGDATLQALCAGPLALVDLLHPNMQVLPDPNLPLLSHEGGNAGVSFQILIRQQWLWLEMRHHAEWIS
jgi:hypothetical protein